MPRSVTGATTINFSMRMHSGIRMILDQEGEYLVMGRSAMLRQIIRGWTDGHVMRRSTKAPKWTPLKRSKAGQDYVQCSVMLTPGQIEWLEPLSRKMAGLSSSQLIHFFILHYVDINPLLNPELLPKLPEMKTKREQVKVQWHTGLRDMVDQEAGILGLDRGEFCRQLLSNAAGRLESFQRSPNAPKRTALSARWEGSTDQTTVTLDTQLCKWVDTLSARLGGTSLTHILQYYCMSYMDINILPSMVPAP